MSLTPSQLETLYYQIITMLDRKRSKIPARIFESGREPTISDILTGNESALELRFIPPELQLPFVFDYYQHFVNSHFRVNKKAGHGAINKAIFYWQMDDTHSLTSHQPPQANLLQHPHHLHRPMPAHMELLRR